MNAGWTVLCIDDTRDIRMLVRTLLERDGAAVRLAGEGEEGVACATADPPDAIVLDLHMPGIGGLETLRRLRGHPALARVPVLVMTGRGDPATVAAARAAGADDVIQKPFAPAELRARLRAAARLAPATPDTAAPTDLGWLWTESRAEAIGRLEVVEDGAASALAGGLTEDARRRAEGAAHRLAGSLGIFGLARGSRLARKIEERFRDGVGIGDAPALAALVRRLRAALADAPAPAPPAGAEARHECRSVLVVDDDALVLGAVRGLLESSGVRVATLSAPRAFGQRMEAERPDLVLLDVDMPEVDGIELCRLLRDDPRWRTLPVLFLTGHADGATSARAAAAGADECLDKSIAAPELVKRIGSYLDRR